MIINNSTIKRFEQKISPDPNTGCWLWTATTRRGYGALYINGKKQNAHVVSWEIYKKIPRGDKFVCHKCNIKSCVNPSHLYLGTPSQNTRYFVATGMHHHAKKTHCKHGHIFSSKNTYFYFRNSGVRRECRICRRRRHEKHYAKKRRV